MISDIRAQRPRLAVVVKNSTDLLVSTTFLYSVALTALGLENLGSFLFTHGCFWLWFPCKQY